MLATFASANRNQQQTLKPDFNKLIGQGYDGTTTMSGQKVGVATIVRGESAPQI